MIPFLQASVKLIVWNLEAGGRHGGLAKKSTPTVAVVYTVCLVVLLLNEIKKEH